MNVTKVIALLELRWEQNLIAIQFEFRGEISLVKRVPAYALKQTIFPIWLLCSILGNPMSVVDDYKAVTGSTFAFQPDYNRLC